MSQPKVHEFKVGMTCEGCSNQVRRVLDKHKGQGIDNVEINLASQIVKVTSSLQAQDILTILKKTGKTVEYIASSN